MGSLWWLVWDIGLEFGPSPRAGPEGPWPPGPKALGLDVSVLCQDLGCEESLVAGERVRVGLGLG